MQKNTILAIVAGKSGGHLIPGLTIAQQFVQENTQAKIILFTTNSMLDRSIVSTYSFLNKVIPLKLENFPRKKVLRYPLFIINLIKAFSTSFLIFIKHRPKKVVSMGGYISIPVCMAAFMLRIPIHTYELNATPGTAVRALRYISQKIYVCFTNALDFFPIKKVELTHYPIRFDSHHKFDRKIALEKLALDPKRKTLLILGGSQGSQFLNTSVLNFLKSCNYLHEQIQIIHQTGSHELSQLKLFYSKCSFPVITFDYRNDIEICYNAADIVLARAGAGTLFELSFFNRKALIIPLQTSTTIHQEENARAINKMKPQNFSLLRQKDIESNPELLYNALSNYLLIDV